MIISIVSGKGGTGKTTIATNLAVSLGANAQLLDCDVEEPNAHLFINPSIQSRQKVFIQVPAIDKTRCDFCGKCQEVCVFNAVAVLKDNVLVFPELCHSCGACCYFCPSQAIREIEKEVGIVDIGQRGHLQFVSGRLHVGQAVALPVIKAVKAHINLTRTVILDAPPGTSCPVIETVRESQYCIVVTEPTPFGFNDFQLIVELLRKIERPFGVVINRCDLGSRITEEYCQREGIPVLSRIPFAREIALAYSRGELLVEKMPEMRQVFQALVKRIDEEART